MNYREYREKKHKSGLSKFGRKVYDMYGTVGWEVQKGALPKALVLIVAFILVASAQSFLAGILIFSLAYLLYKAL